MWWLISLKNAWAHRKAKLLFVCVYELHTRHLEKNFFPNIFAESLFVVVVVVYMPSCLYTKLKDLRRANTGAQAVLRKCYNYLVTLPIC